MPSTGGQDLDPEELRIIQLEGELAKLRSATQRLHEWKGRLSEKVEALQNVSRTLSQHGDKQRGAQGGVLQSAAEAEVQVRGAMDQLRKVVDAKEQALLADLEEMKAERLSALEACCSENDEAVERVESVLNDAEILGGKGRQEFLAQVPNVEELIDEQLRLAGDHTQRIPAISSVAPFSFRLDVGHAKNTIFGINFATEEQKSLHLPPPLVGTSPQCRLKETTKKETRSVDGYETGEEHLSNQLQTTSPPSEEEDGHTFSLGETPPVAPPQQGQRRYTSPSRQHQQQRPVSRGGSAHTSAKFIFQEQENNCRGYRSSHEEGVPNSRSCKHNKHCSGTQHHSREHCGGHPHRSASAGPDRGANSRQGLLLGPPRCATASYGRRGVSEKVNSSGGGGGGGGSGTTCRGDPKHEVRIQHPQVHHGFSGLPGFGGRPTSREAGLARSSGAVSRAGHHHSRHSQQQQQQQQQQHTVMPGASMSHGMVRPRPLSAADGLNNRLHHGPWRHPG